MGILGGVSPLCSHSVLDINHFNSVQIQQTIWGFRLSDFRRNICGSVANASAQNAVIICGDKMSDNAMKT